MQRLQWHYHKNAACALYKQQMSHICSHSNSYNWRSHVRSSLKDALNSSVPERNVRCSNFGRAFQWCGHCKCAYLLNCCLLFKFGIECTQDQSCRGLHTGKNSNARGECTQGTRWNSLWRRTACGMSTFGRPCTNKHTNKLCMNTQWLQLAPSEK